MDGKAQARTVGRLCLDRLPVGRDQLGGHHAQAAEPLREDVGLHVAVVVLARPHEAALRLDRLCDHVVDETVLVVDAGVFEGLLVLAVNALVDKTRRRRGWDGRIVDLLEYILEATVVLLENGILCRHELEKESIW